MKPLLGAGTPFEYVLKAALLLMCLAFLLPNGYSVARFFFLKDNFVIVDSYASCEKPLNNRCSERYHANNENGEALDFEPFIGQFDHFLEKGFSFRKVRYGFSYTANNKVEHWPLLGSLFFQFLVGCGLLVLWYLVGGFTAISMLWKAKKSSDE